MIRLVQPTGPAIDCLLQAAHRQLSVLRARRAELLLCGIDDAHLPDERALQSFALLGDHARKPLMTELRGAWVDLEWRGLAVASVDEAATPEVRLLASVLPVAHTVEPIHLRMQRAEKLPIPEPAAWRCTRRIQGLRGQVAKIPFAHAKGSGLTHLWIEPAAVFGRKPKLWIRPPETGYFRLPIDDGEIRITMRSRDGRMWRHTIQSRVEEALSWN